jgi:hypothetical protein
MYQSACSRTSNDEHARHCSSAGSQNETLAVRLMDDTCSRNKTGLALDPAPSIHRHPIGLTHYDTNPTPAT